MTEYETLSIFLQSAQLAVTLLALYAAYQSSSGFTNKSGDHPIL